MRSGHKAYKNEKDTLGEVSNAQGLVLYVRDELASVSDTTISQNAKYAANQPHPHIRGDHHIFSPFLNCS